MAVDAINSTPCASFITKDSYEGDLKNPLTLNLYTYCWNSPIRYVDPTGHFVWALAAIPFVAVVEFVAVVAVAAVAVVVTYEAYEAAQDLYQANTSNNESGVIDSNDAQEAESIPDNSTVAVDPYGNAIPLNPGDTIAGSPDGDYWQVKDSAGKRTGDRYDGGGHKNQADPKAQEPHAHRVDQTGKPILDSSGNPHLSTNAPAGSKQLLTKTSSGMSLVTYTPSQLANIKC